MHLINSKIFALVGISLFAHVTLSGGRIAASLFVLQQGQSEIIAGLVYGLYSLMPALLAVHMGQLVDRVGPRLVMRICLAIMATGLLFPILKLSLFTIIICALLGGLGFGGYIVAAHTAVSLIKVENASDRTSLYSWLQMGTSVSAVAGPALIGVIIDNANYTIAYICLSAIVFIGFIWSNFAKISNGIPFSKNKQGQGIFKTTVKDKSLSRIYLLSMLVYLAWDSFSFMIPVLGNVRDYSATSIGLALSFFAVGTFLVRAIQPWIAQRINEWQTLSIAFALAAVVFLLLPVANSLPFLYALSLVFGISAGVGHPNVQNLIIRHVDPAMSGAASGLRLMTGNMAGMIGTAGCGALTAIVGITPVFIGIAAVMSVSSIVSARSKIDKDS